MRITNFMYISNLKTFLEMIRSLETMQHPNSFCFDIQKQIFFIKWCILFSITLFLTLISLLHKFFFKFSLKLLFLVPFSLVIFLFLSLSNKKPLKCTKIRRKGLKKIYKVLNFILSWKNWWSSILHSDQICRCFDTKKYKNHIEKIILFLPILS